MAAAPKQTALRQFDTCRLIPSRFADAEDSVLAPLSDNNDMLRDLFDLDNATNERLRGEYGGLPGIGVDELVFGVPNFRIINAAVKAEMSAPSGQDLQFTHTSNGRFKAAHTITVKIVIAIRYGHPSRRRDNRYLAHRCLRHHTLRKD